MSSSEHTSHVKWPHGWMTYSKSLILQITHIFFCFNSVFSFFRLSRTVAWPHNLQYYSIMKIPVMWSVMYMCIRGVDFVFVSPMCPLYVHVKWPHGWMTYSKSLILQITHIFFCFNSAFSFFRLSRTGRETVYDINQLQMWHEPYLVII
jgi:hypothetical protein